MARKPKIELIRAIPGARNLQRLLESRCRRLDCAVTAFDSQLLGQAKALLHDHPTAQVEEFGKVVSRYLALNRGTPRLLPGSELVEACVERALTSLPPDSMLGGSAQFRGAHRVIARSLDTLRSWGQEAGRLADLADRSSENLAPWLREMDAIAESVEVALDTVGRRFCSASMRECMEEPASYRSSEALIVLAGTSIVPLELDWLRWAAESGAEVTVIVESATEAQPGLFAAADWWESELGTAKREGTPNYLAQTLFTESVAASATPEVRVMMAPDLVSECEWILREALAQNKGGLPYEGMGILVRREDEYSAILAACAMRLDVPLQESRRVPLLSNRLVEFQVSLLETLAGRDVRPLVRLAKTSYLRLSIADQALLQNAVNDSHRARGRSWETLTAWAKESDFEWLQSALAWREECTQSSMTCAEWKAKWEALGGSEWMTKANDVPSPHRERDSYAQSAFLRTLAVAASVHRMGGDSAMDMATFAKLARKACDEAEVHLPAAQSGIQVGNSARSFVNVDVLFVTGMLEGTLPRRRSEDPLLTDEHLAALAELLPTLPPIPDSHRRAEAERDELYRIVCTPGKLLFLSYPGTSEERDNIPTAYLEEIKRLAGDVQSEVKLRSELVPDDAISEADARLKAALADPPMPPAKTAIINESSQVLLRQVAARPVSPEGVIAALECPFRYFLGHMFQVHPRSRANHSLRLLNIVRKSALPAKQDPEEAHAALLEERERFYDQIYADTDPAELALLEAESQRLITEWVNREMAVREAWPVDTVWDTETHFGGHHLLKKLGPKVGPSFELRGGPACILRRGEHTVAMLYEVGSPLATNDDLPGEGKLKALKREAYQKAMIYLIRLSGTHRGVEFDSVSGDRVLVETPASGRKTKGRRWVIPLSEQEFHDLRSQFFLEVTQNALDVVLAPIVDPTPGAAQCEYCDLGELCRRHTEFGEGRFGG